MTSHRFQPGQTLVWADQTYEVRRLLADSQLTLINLRTGAGLTVALTDLVQAILDGDLHLSSGEVTDPPPGIPSTRAWADYPAALRAVADYRWSIIAPLLDLPPAERRQAIIARVEECRAQGQTTAPTLQTALSEASIYRWLKLYLDSNGDRRALIPDTRQRGGADQSRLQAETEAIISATIADHYYVQERRSTDYIHREVAVRIDEENKRRPPDRQLPLPSRTTIWRRLTSQAVQQNRATQQEGQGGKRPVIPTKHTPYPTLPLERVEIDHTRADIIVVDDTDFLPLGRLTLTYCLDTATRYPLGYYLGFEPPSYLAVMACLHHAISPKGAVQTRYGTAHPWLAHGIPYTLVVDNGKEFIGQDLSDACQLLGMILQQTPPRTPHFKAAMERMFGTLNTGLLHTLPGTTFSDLAQRGAYQSLDQACLTLTDLDQILHLFLLDIYAESFHQGLGDIPACRWEQATQAGFFPRVPASAGDLHIFLGRVAYRTVQPYGIELHNLRYNHMALTPLRTRLIKQRDRRVKLKYDPADLSRIYVYDPDEERYLTVPAVAQTYTQGLSLWKHRVICNFVRSRQQRIDLVALGQAQRQIQEIVEASLIRKKGSARAKIARWQHPPTSPEPVAETADPPLIIDQIDSPAPQPALDFELELDPEQLRAEGWGLSYDYDERTLL